MAIDRFQPFDRVPPHSLEAEQAVLGSMLIERPALEKGTEILKPEDFYRDAHRYIFEAMLALAQRDEPVDLIFLSDELKQRGYYDQVGGLLYLQNLMEAPSTAANVEYYAHIVEEKSIMRRLLDAGTQIQGLAYSTDYEAVDDVVDRAERLVFEVGQRRMGQFFFHLRPLLDEELDRIEKRYENKGIATGRMTPFDDLNYKTAGLHPSDLIIVAARPGMGKCLSARTLVDDPATGERLTMERAVQRKLPAVLGISEVGCVRPTTITDWIDSGIKPCYRVRTRTGREVEVTGHHPFLTVQGWQPLHELRVGNAIAVPRAVPTFGEDEAEPDARVRLLAYYLAEGGLTQSSPRFTNIDPVLISDFQSIIAEQFPDCKIQQYGIDYAVVQAVRSSRPNPVTVWLRERELWGKYADTKHFPTCVWMWSRPKLALFLRVLFSCDGTIYPMGGYPRIEFAVASERLARDVQHALTRFGIVAKCWRKSARCWRVEITEPESVSLYQCEIGWIGEKAERFPAACVPRRSIVGHAPKQVWDVVRQATAAKQWSLSELARRAGETVNKGYNPHTNRSVPSVRLRPYARLLANKTLLRASSPDLYWDEIAAIEDVGEQQVYDLTVADGANFIAQDICVHNTTLAVQMAQHIALNEKIPVALFSLEMSKEQLVTRMICSEAKVDAHRLRTGYLQTDDWQRVGEGISRLAEAPIYIDDTPDVSVMEMRAKCRRLKAEQGLGLVMIDYLQLMRSHKKTDNRTQEISEIARGCKQLARELKVPVIALSQLSRAVESRPDKRPLLSDLRECVTGDTLLTDADTGRQIAIRDVLPGTRILGMNALQKIEAFAVEDVWATGIKPVFTLRTRTGKQITASGNHPFLTARGWLPLEQLKVGDVIASVMRLPEHGEEKPERADLCRLLGYLTGDGTHQTHRAVGFCGSDKTHVADVCDIVKTHFPSVQWRFKKNTERFTELDFVCLYANGYGKPGGNPLREWLRCVGVQGCRDNSKFVPDYVFEAGIVGAREFLAGYFASDGCVKKLGKYWNLHFDTVSHRLAEGVQSLLLRLGIVSGINQGYVSSKATQPIFRVHVYSFDANLRRFVTQIPVRGQKGCLLQEIAKAPPANTTNGSLFSLPVEVSALMFARTQHLRQQGRKLEGGRLYWKPQGKSPRRDSCAKIAAQLNDTELACWAESDLLWEPILAIESAGEQETFDIKVACANFVGNGILAHNSGSIEAEADIVMFIYREAYYKMKEAGEKGDELEKPDRDAEVLEETELIIAKHRSGPTGKVLVGFLPQYTRFENLDTTRYADEE